MRQFLERIINERAKAEITISEAQAGGQREASMIGHITTVKELIGKTGIYCLSGCDKNPMITYIKA